VLHPSHCIDVHIVQIKGGRSESLLETMRLMRTWFKAKDEDDVNEEGFARCASFTYDKMSADDGPLDFERLDPECLNSARLESECRDAHLFHDAVTAPERSRDASSAAGRALETTSTSSPTSNVASWPSSSPLPSLMPQTQSQAAAKHRSRRERGPDEENERVPAGGTLQRSLEKGGHRRWQANVNYSLRFRRMPSGRRALQKSGQGHSWQAMASPRCFERDSSNERSRTASFERLESEHEASTRRPRRRSLRAPLSLFCCNVTHS